MGAAFAPAPFGTGTARVKFGGRREGVLGGSLLGGSRPGRRSAGGAARLGSAGLGIPGIGSSSMGRSLLGGSVFSRRPPSPFSRTAVFGRSASLGLSSPPRHRGNPAGGGLAGPAPRFSRGSSFARLSAGLRRSAGPKSPGRGWLRGVSSRRGSLGGNTLGGASMRRRAFGGRRTGRSLAGRNFAGRSFAGRSFAGRGISRRGLSASGTPRLRMPRPKTRRRRRTGGYR